MTSKLDTIFEFASINNFNVEDAGEGLYFVTSRKTRKVYNWDGYETVPVHTFRFELEEKGGWSGDTATRAKLYKTDSGFKKSISRFQSELSILGTK